ncbi:MAG: MFS transporter, partial [Jatrophihabitantaceae bacterium]
YRFGLNLGTTIAPLLGFALYYLDHRRYTLLFWVEASVALIYAALALFALPPKQRGSAEADAGTNKGGSYLEVLRDRRYTMYLAAAFFNTVVYVQYLSTLPLDIKAQGMALLWYTVAVALNGALVIAFELPLTKISQRWPLKISIGLAFALVGLGMASYGLPLGPAVVVLGTLIWTTGEVVGAPAVFAYPAMAGPAHLKGRYIASFQFMFAAGSAIGPVIGGALFTVLGHRVWPVLAVASAVALLLGLAAVRPPATVAESADVQAPAAADVTPLPAAAEPSG